MKLAKNIENIRLSRGLNKAEFGKLFNTTGSLVGRWERGIVVPNETRLLKLANYAGITVEELKYGNELERKKRNEDIEMWKRILENHTNNLKSLERLKDSNYHTDIMGLLTDIDNDLLKIIVKIDAGKLNLEGVKMELDTLQSGLDAVSFDTYDDMKALDANIASNKSAIDLANRKLKELGYSTVLDNKNVKASDKYRYNSASNNKTDAE